MAAGAEASVLPATAVCILSGPAVQCLLCSLQNAAVAPTCAKCCAAPLHAASPLLPLGRSAQCTASTLLCCLRTHQLRDAGTSRTHLARLAGDIIRNLGLNGLALGAFMIFDHLSNGGGGFGGGGGGGGLCTASVHRPWCSNPEQDAAWLGVSRPGHAGSWLQQLRRLQHASRLARGKGGHSPKTWQGMTRSLLLPTCCQVEPLLDTWQTYRNSLFDVARCWLAGTQGLQLPALCGRF